MVVHSFTRPNSELSFYVRSVEVCNGENPRQWHFVKIIFKPLSLVTGFTRTTANDPATLLQGAERLIHFFPFLDYMNSTADSGKIKVTGQQF